MKKLITAAAAAALVLGLAGIASAVCIDNNSGQSCGDGPGDWHFVNNQLRGADTTGEYITVVYTSGEECMVLADADRGGSNTAHFDCNGYSGAIVSACTDLPGKLVLSDFSCEPKEPPCEPDPKTGECPPEPK